MSYYSGNPAFKPFTNAKRITHALYQNMGDEVANPVDIDTVDDAPERAQRRVHCIRLLVLYFLRLRRPAKKVEDSVEGRITYCKFPLRALDSNSREYRH